MARRKDPLTALGGGGIAVIVVAVMIHSWLCGESDSDRETRERHEQEKSEADQRAAAARREKERLNECQEKFKEAQRQLLSFKVGDEFTSYGSDGTEQKGKVTSTDTEAIVAGQVAMHSLSAKCYDYAAGRVGLPDFKAASLQAQRDHWWKSLSKGQQTHYRQKALAICYRGEAGSAKCCDGSLSDKCTCRGGRGCCSRHKGVCGCDCPIDELVYRFARAF